MAAGVLNYTTTINVRKTVGEIQETLAEAGASDITLRYNPQTRQPLGVEFTIDTPYGLRWYTLPANVEPVYQTLVRQKRRTSRIQATREQAERVAWRILKDWLAAQLAVIETGMVSLSQVFLPYERTDDGRTVYEVYAAHQAALPAPAAGAA